MGLGMNSEESGHSLSGFGRGRGIIGLADTNVPGLWNPGPTEHRELRRPHVPVQLSAAGRIKIIFLIRMIFILKQNSHYIILFTFYVFKYGYGFKPQHLQKHLTHPLILSLLFIFLN
jgi:hypothetical protein